MRAWRSVFALVPDCHVSAGHYRTLWQRHFYGGIRGVVERTVIPEGIDFDWAQRQTAGDPRFDALRAATSETLLEQIRSAHASRGLDVVVSYCFSRDLEPGLVKDVVALGVPWVNFYCDSTHRFGEVEALARVTSLNWFPESAAAGHYAALGVPSVCLPYALNPDYLPDCSATSSKRGAAFIGLPSTNRITQLGVLRLLGCPVDIRGHGWIGADDDPFYNPAPRVERALRALVRRGAVEKVLRRVLWPLVRRQARGALSDDAFFPYLRECGVVLGLNQGRDELGRLTSYLKFRDVEFPGYGCCYLTERNEDIARAFHVGVEVLTFDTLRDAARQIRRLASSPGRSAEIGRAGRARVLAEHTWRARLKQLAERL